MRLKLTATGDNRLIRMLRRYARENPSEEVELVSDADAADVIVLVETVDWRDPHFRRVRRHPLVREYPHKAVLYNEADTSRARLPALAVNALDVPWQIGIGSLPIHEDQAPLEPATTEPEELMSFVGSRSSAVRHAILDRYASAHPSVIDTDAFNAWQASAEERRVQRRTFERALACGLFALCPHGLGTTSLRLYEAMQVGRCPVIIADRWVGDFGVDWSFALRVAEKDHSRLEEILGAVPRSEALERGAEARRQWQAAYSPERYVDTLARAARSLVERRPTVPPRTPGEVLGDGCHTLLLRARTLKNRLAHSRRRPVASA